MHLLMRFPRPFLAPDEPAGGGAAPPGGPAGGGAPPGGTGAGGGTPPGGGSPPAAFATQLPADIREEAAFRDIKDLDGLARGYLGAQKKLGVPADQLFRVPGADADDKVYDEIYGKLGRPESPDKYTLKPPEGQKDWGEPDKQFHAAMLPALHKAGLNQRQLETIMGAWNDYAGKVKGAEATATAAGIEAARTKLQGEWGDKFDENIGLADQALTHFATAAKIDRKALGAELERDSLGNRPELSRLFAHLGRQLTEDGTLRGRAEGSSGAMSPIEAKQAINALNNDDAFQKAFRNKSHPGHADAVARRQGLFDIAYPGGA